jgi:hypothetical protein
MWIWGYTDLTRMMYRTMEELAADWNWQWQWGAGIYGDWREAQWGDAGPY